MAILCLRQMFCQVGVQSRAARKVTYVFFAVQLELVYYIERIVFYDIEIAVVAVASDGITVFFVPFGVFYAYVLGRYHLTIEHQLFGAIFFVVFLYKSQYLLYESRILRIVVDRYAHKLCRLYQTINPDGKVLTLNIYVACIEKRQHTLCLQYFQILVVCSLSLMYEVDDLFEEVGMRPAVADGILHTAVDIDCQHTLGTGRYSARTKRIAESVVGYLVAEAAATRQRIGIVAHIGEKRVSFGIHLGCEVGIFFVDNIAVCRQ